MIGRTLGHYEVLEQIGAGGMGEVYRARDTRLQRDVAIKVIPPKLLGDKEHRARFEREARLLASLGHPHIAAIHGLEEHGGVLFLVLEFINGADLAQRLTRGPLPVEEVLRIARQVADALESAPRQGVIHRDLKPSNIALAADGAVKVLDFGLAKALDAGSPDSSGTLSQSPTVLAGATASHAILGTAAYMSPEQARGHRVDSRADVWAFGCVVFECLTGKRALEGESISDTLAAVLRDPIDWSRLPAETPPALRRLLHRCLERDPARRLHSLADARLELEDAADELRSGVDQAPAQAPARSPMRSRPGARLPWILVAGLVTVLVALLTIGRTALPPTRVARFAIPVDSLEISGVCPPAISPDGSRVAYSASGHLWVRALDRLEARALEGTDGARSVFWSPDGAVIGFEARKRLWRVPADGGPAVAICDIPEEFTDVARANWGEDGRIVFASGDGSIYEVSVAGGVAASILDPEPGRDDDFHSPGLLPEGRGILFVPHPLGGARDGMDLLRGGERRVVWKAPADATIEAPTYSAGHVLFRRDQPDPGIWAVPFSLRHLRVEGDPFLVAHGGGLPSVSRDGTLVYASVDFEGHRLVRIDADGTMQEEPVDRGRHIDDAALSPSGARLLEGVLEGSHYNVVVQDLSRGTRSVVASGAAALNPFWISDSTVGVVHSDSTQLVAYDLGGAAPPRVLFHGRGRGAFQRMTAAPVVTKDERHVLFVLHATSTKSDIWIAPVSGSGETHPLLASAAREEGPQVSAAAPLFAYVSDESGRPEVYLSRLDPQASAPSHRWQVSSDGGSFPRWSHDGTRLYYESEGMLMEVAVKAAAEVALSRPHALFNLRMRSLELNHGYAVDPRDSTFLMIQAGDPTATRRDIIVVQNWLAEFRKR